jgi:hypothetical protein
MAATGGGLSEERKAETDGAGLDASFTQRKCREQDRKSQRSAKTAAWKAA